MPAFVRETFLALSLASIVCCSQPKQTIAAFSPEAIALAHTYEAVWQDATFRSELASLPHLSLGQLYNSAVAQATSAPQELGGVVLRNPLALLHAEAQGFLNLQDRMPSLGAYFLALGYNAQQLPTHADPAATQAFLSALASAARGDEGSRIDEGYRNLAIGVHMALALAFSVPHASQGVALGLAPGCTSSNAMCSTDITATAAMAAAFGGVSFLASSSSSSSLASSSSSSSTGCGVQASNCPEDTITKACNLQSYLRSNGGKLPSNYVSKAKLSQNGISNFSNYVKNTGKMIGGDPYYGMGSNNFAEADLSADPTTACGVRGANRLVWNTNDYSAQVTCDHYKTFTTLACPPSG